MLSGIIAYQILGWENPTTIDKVKAVLEKHPWYANQWKARLQEVPVFDRDMMLFMQASRWADDIRSKDKAQNRSSWHYINLPFNPQGQPLGVQRRDPDPVNILTAMAENESVVRKENDPERRAIDLRGSSISWATYINLYTRRSYSRWNIRTATGAAIKSASE